MPAGSGGFVVPGADVGRDWLVAGAGLNLAITRYLSLFSGFDGQFKGYQTLHTGNRGLEVRW